ncbi:hypothetical protein BBJ28_00025895 [Nothophytophthora sp. Chile5]|nr:hypothetical protein BBJ28_00025895 [Nothophytophthora sp. Chile5]
MILGEDTKISLVGDKGLTLMSSRVRKDETLSVTFASSEEQKHVHELIRRWITLGAFLQSLSALESIAKSPNSIVYRCRDRDDATKQFTFKRVHRARSRGELELTARVMELRLESSALEPYLARYEFLFEGYKSKCVTMVMLYYPGGSLADRIRARGPLCEATARSVLSSLCRALHLLHQNRVLHLDVKASNILFDDGPTGSFCNLKLVDFGSGALVDSAASGEEETPKTAGSDGTYGCMAPERFEGRCGPEADVYGAGIVLYHMISGDIPFAGTDTYQLIARNMQGDVSFAGEQWRRVSPPLQRLAEWMLDKNPAKRITFPEILQLPWLFEAPERSAIATGVHANQPSHIHSQAA